MEGQAVGGTFSIVDTAVLTSSAGRTHLRAAQTGGIIGVSEAIFPPGYGVHWHTHTREDETFQVISGSFRVWCGDGVADAGPGSVIFAPRGLRHRWQNIGSSEGQLLFILTPGGFESFFDDLAALPEVTPATIFALEARYGVRSEILDGQNDDA
jgi:quercetin dioxygenase-like cupin family protein